MRAGFYTLALRPSILSFLFNFDIEALDNEDGSCSGVVVVEDSGAKDTARNCYLFNTRIGSFMHIWGSL